jgi:hypothetical protein
MRTFLEPRTKGQEQFLLRNTNRCERARLAAARPHFLLRGDSVRLVTLLKTFSDATCIPPPAGRGFSGRSPLRNLAQPLRRMSLDITFQSRALVRGFLLLGTPVSLGMKDHQMQNI